MSNWNELPFEILTTIFRNFRSCSWLNINTEELHQCALTCRNWKHVAQLMLFSSTTVESTPQLLQLCRAIMADPTVGTIVKRLDVGSSDVLLDLNTFELIADAFPNIEALEFGDLIQSYDYFYELASNDRFPNLTSIPGPGEPYQNEVYFECLEKKKSSTDSITLLGTQALKYWKDRLDEFPILHAIYIEFYSGEPINFMYFVEDLTRKDKLSSVTHLCIKLSQSEEGNSFKALDRVQPIYNITNLDIIGPKDHTIISDDFMLYIMKKFPNLKCFSITSDEEFETDEDSFSRIREYTPLSADIAVQFLKYCSNTGCSSVGTMVTEEKTPMIVKNFCSANIDDKKSAKYPCLRMVYEGKYDIDTHSFNACHPVLSMDSIKLSQNDNDILVTYDRLLGNQRKGLQLIELAGRYFTNVSIKCLPDFIYSELLDFIGRHCTRLKKLSIEEGDGLHDTPNYANLIPNNTLTELELKDYCILTDTSSTLLSYIEKLFPSLQNISITSHDYENFGEMAHFLLHMPSISLQHLKIDFDFFSNPINWKSAGTKGVCIAVLTFEKAHCMTFDFEDLPAHHQLKKQDKHQPAEFIKTITASEHQDLIDERHYYTLEINCKSLKKFTMKYELREKLELFF